MVVGIGIDICEGSPYDVSLAPTSLMTDDRSGGGGNFRGAVA